MVVFILSYMPERQLVANFYGSLLRKALAKSRFFKVLQLGARTFTNLNFSSFRFFWNKVIILEVRTWKAYRLCILQCLFRDSYFIILLRCILAWTKVCCGPFIKMWSHSIVWKLLSLVDYSSFDSAAPWFTGVQGWDFITFLVVVGQRPSGSRARPAGHNVRGFTQQNNGDIKRHHGEGRNEQYSARSRRASASSRTGWAEQHNQDHHRDCVPYHAMFCILTNILYTSRVFYILTRVRALKYFESPTIPCIHLLAVLCVYFLVCHCKICWQLNDCWPLYYL